MPADISDCTMPEPTEWNQCEGIETEVCPVRFYDAAELAIAGHVFKRDGILPRSGGWQEQPALLMDGIEIVDRERAAYGK